MTRQADGTPTAGAARREGPLSGLVVLDVTHVMAGSYCSLLLAEMGADVIKVERAGGGDDLRRSQRSSGGHFRPHDAVNHSKRSLALDLRDARGAEVLARLAERADVFVENYRPGTLDRLGVGASALRQRNPQLITCSISGFGGSGPHADRPGFDLVAQAMAGIMSLTGEADRPPVVAGVPMADLNAGLFAALGILSALQERTRSQLGQHVDTSLFESALAYTIWESALWFDTGTVAGPAGRSHRLGSPYGAFATRDGSIVIGAATQPIWERLCRVLEREEWLTDERHASSLARIENKQSLTSAIESVLETRDTAWWEARLLEAGVPCGPVQSIDRAHEDPQARAREMSVSLGVVDGRERKVVGAPVKLSRTPWRIGDRASGYGEDGEAVLREFGFADDEIEALRRAGTIERDGDPC